MDASEAKRLKALEDDNRRVKKLLADSMLDNAAFKDILGNNGNARYGAGGCRSSPNPI